MNSFGGRGQEKPPIASGWRRLLKSRHASLLTHVSLALCLAAMFALLLRAPLYIAFVPCALLEHRVGILVHEYVHGIPFRRHHRNLHVITFVDGLTLSFGMLELFRNSHLAHHRWLNTERDPAWTNESEAQRRSGLLGVLWQLELPQHVLFFRDAIAGRRIHIRRGRVAAGALMSLGWIAFWISTGRWWMWPALQAVVLYTATVSSSLRGAVEHHGAPEDPRFGNEYRSFIPLFNLNRHVHHHLEPGLPWYRLEFVSARPLPAHCFFTHWFEVYVRRRFVLLRPRFPSATSAIAPR